MAWNHIKHFKWQQVPLWFEICKTGKTWLSIECYPLVLCRLAQPVQSRPQDFPRPSRFPSGNLSGLRKSLRRRGWISQYLPRFGGARIQSDFSASKSNVNYSPPLSLRLDSVGLLQHHHLNVQQIFCLIMDTSNCDNIDCNWSGLCTHFSENFERALRAPGQGRCRQCGLTCVIRKDQMLLLPIYIFLAQNFDADFMNFAELFDHVTENSGYWTLP